MSLTREQLETFKTEGWLLLPGCFSPEEVALLKSELASEFRIDSERRVLEKGGAAVRSVYGSHAVNEVFGRLVRLPRLVEAARQILDGDIYVHQFKVNAKVAFGGDIWEWHQDYIFWLKEDGIPEPLLVNVVVYLDDVTEFNGPIFLVNRTHREGVLSSRTLEATPEGYADQPAWISNLTADLKYTISREMVAHMVRRYGLSSAKGPAGSVLFFHPNMLHGSNPNMSPFDRQLAMVTYNRVENLPRVVENRRPWFLVSDQCDPLTPLESDTLAPQVAVSR